MSASANLNSLSICLGLTVWGFAVQGGALCDSARAVLVDRTAAPALAGKPCELVRSGDGLDQYFCSQAFAFRSDAASNLYDQHVAELRDCFDAIEVPIGPAVNHPDSYHQTVFDVEGRKFSVALKDKGALQQTFVFVRLPAY